MREPRKDEKLMIDECFKNGGFLANDVLQVVTSPCIIPRSFPPCLVSGPALLGVTKHSRCFWCPGIQPLPLGSQSSVPVPLQLCTWSQELSHSSSSKSHLMLLLVRLCLCSRERKENKSYCCLWNGSSVPPQSVSLTRTLQNKLKSFCAQLCVK